MKSATKWFLLAVLLALVLGAAPQPSSAQCQPTGFFDPETNQTLNAFIVNPPTEVTGTIVVPGCNIGVYFNTGQGQVGDKKLPQTDISGATHYGVLVDGGVNDVDVGVTNTHVHNIRDNTKPNSQQGVGISYRGFTEIGTAGGTVSNNQVDDYQKGGIEANGEGVNVTIRDNTVTGSPLPPAQNTFLAQNGIQVGFGAKGSVTGNTVTFNSVHNPDDSGFAATGVLVVGGPFYNGSAACPNSTSTNPCPYTIGTMVLKNTLNNNDVGAYLSTPASDGVSPPTTMTNNKVVNNTMSISSCSNAYMTGATDVGFNDKVINNNITGYSPSNPITGGCFPVDNGGTATKVHVSPHK